jgi:hypothetical protein
MWHSHKLQGFLSHGTKHCFRKQKQTLWEGYLGLTRNELICLCLDKCEPHICSASLVRHQLWKNEDPITLYLARPSKQLALGDHKKKKKKKSICFCWERGEWAISILFGLLTLSHACCIFTQSSFLLPSTTATSPPRRKLLLENCSIWCNRPPCCFLLEQTHCEAVGSTVLSCLWHHQ